MEESESLDSYTSQSNRFGAENLTELSEEADPRYQKKENPRRGGRHNGSVPKSYGKGISNGHSHRTTTSYPKKKAPVSVKSQLPSVPEPSHSNMKADNLSSADPEVEASQTQGTPLNLASENPIFMSEYWAKRSVTITPGVKYASSSCDNTRKLNNLLKDFVRTWFKGGDFNLRHLVIANGSTQLLFAYVWGLRQIKPGLTINLIRPCPEPCLQLPTIFAGLEVTHGEADLVIEFPGLYLSDVVTPEGAVSKAGSNGRMATLRVCHYTSPPFGNFNSPKGDAIFSMSDGIGLPGLKVGFGFVDNHRLRELIQTYIDNESRGVSPLNFGITETLLSDSTFAGNLFEYAGRILKSRWEQLEKVGDPFILNHEGPFAWFERSESIFERHGIKGLPGTKVGLSDRYTRISLVVSEARFKRFLTVLTEIVKLKE